MTDEARVREVAMQVVEAVRGVVREKQVTEDELHATAAFLNRVGAAGFFPSMLDIAFAMTVVDRKREGLPGTRPNLEGPEYVPGAPERPGGSLFEREPSADAKLLTLRGRLTDALTGEPIAGAELDFWHADENGTYDRKGFHLRGLVRTAADGSYEMRTVLPHEYAEHAGDPIGELLDRMGLDNYRAAHIHLKVRVDGEERLTTQFFHRYSAHLDSDYVVGAVSDDLILDLESVPGSDGKELEGVFDIALAPIRDAVAS